MIALPVPEIIQNDANSNIFDNDCGAAAVAMVLGYYGKLGNDTVNSLARQTALNPYDKGLTCAQLVELGAKHNLALRVHQQTTIDQIRFEVDHGRPVILLIEYRYITAKLFQNAHGGHFVVACGYTSDRIIINDPDVWSAYTDRGFNIPVPNAEIQRAIAEIMDNGRCVFIDERYTMTQEEYDKLTASLLVAESGVKAVRTTLAGFAVTPNPTAPPTASATPVTKYILPTYGNPRESFSTNSKDMGDIPQNTEVHVIHADVLGWWRLVDGPYAGYYLSDTILKDMK